MNPERVQASKALPLYSTVGQSSDLGFLRNDLDDAGRGALDRRR